MSKKNIFKNNFNHSYPVNQVMGLLNMLWKVGSWIISLILFTGLAKSIAQENIGI